MSLVVSSSGSLEHVSPSVSSVSSSRLVLLVLSSALVTLTAGCLRDRRACANSTDCFSGEACSSDGVCVLAQDEVDAGSGEPDLGGVEDTGGGRDLGAGSDLGLERDLGAEADAGTVDMGSDGGAQQTSEVVVIDDDGIAISPHHLMVWSNGQPRVVYPIEQGKKVRVASYDGLAWSVAEAGTFDVLPDDSDDLVDRFEMHEDSSGLLHIFYSTSFGNRLFVLEQDGNGQWIPPRDLFPELQDTPGDWCYLHDSHWSEERVLLLCTRERDVGGRDLVVVARSSSGEVSVSQVASLNTNDASGAKILGYASGFDVFFYLDDGTLARSTATLTATDWSDPVSVHALEAGRTYITTFDAARVEGSRDAWLVPSVLEPWGSSFAVAPWTSGGSVDALEPEHSSAYVVDNPNILMGAAGPYVFFERSANGVFMEHIRYRSPGDAFDVSTALVDETTRGSFPQAYWVREGERVGVVFGDRSTQVGALLYVERDL